MPLILMYHSISPYERDPFEVTVSPLRFEHQMRWLSRRGLRGTSVRELLDAQTTRCSGTLVGLTFDDGYEDFLGYALPILTSFGFTATVFALAGRLGGTNAWDAGGPTKRLLTPDQLRQVVAAGMEIGSHGLTHARLISASGKQLHEELVRSRAVLREISGQQVSGFCYPYGALTAQVMDAVRAAGYDYGCAVWRSALTSRHALTRTYVHDGDHSWRLDAKRVRHSLTAKGRFRLLRPAPVQEAPAITAVSDWSTETCRDDLAFVHLAQEWNELYARCSSATPFQSHAWLDSWWRSYGVSGRLRLVLVRKKGELVALAPFMLRYRGPYAVLSPIGHGVSDFTDILVDDSCATEAVRILCAALREEPRWRVIDMHEVRPAAAAQRLFDHWPGGRWRFADSTCLQLAAKPLHLLLTELGGRTAGTLRRKLKKIDTQGISVSATPVVDVERAVAELLRLHERQWQGRDIDVEHLRPRFAEHLARAARVMVTSGQAELFQYRIGERLLACELVVIGHDFVGDYLRGVDPELRGLIDVTAMLIRHNLNVALRLDCSVYSMLRGVEPHKIRLRPQAVHSQRLLMARTPGGVASYASLVHGRAAVAAMEDRALWWQKIRRGVRQVRAHRARSARERRG
ncbi:MAG: GNAT family N-acetyltransferase [Pseudonocardiaceae bacterium]